MQRRCNEKADFAALIRPMGYKLGLGIGTWQDRRSEIALRHANASTFPAGPSVVFIAWCRGVECC